ncbi:S-adenosyl-L-methionine-dependent methyltransferase [Pseudovirgaria hyperparasitica]|uniref:S-adenosyl-L-methionine-dependent methyltransferase n=1 Tax=Pseudovirgaria hyperparasitica TaxID=470096 RepID=A0A6A6VUL7_9PEZI|nr:S-adenosyl-L-methionine-dependent methyltransferase [Pseudovirgaria hyperparasitica]KAF2754262.1 S-adenosyl-L-methionine-dependent methyltransferase [Pseudovirgaria hyperparasitica]
MYSLTRRPAETTGHQMYCFNSIPIPTTKQTQTNLTQVYSAAASFVPKLTTKVLSYLNANPDDTILDIGCGDGHLTHIIHHSLASPSRITGLDASPSMITSARKSYPSIPFLVQDCTNLADYISAHPTTTTTRGAYTKVFSNAAMHWILAAPDTRAAFFSNVHALLAPGGKFVFEMGGAGNVAEVHATAMAALRAHGVGLADARAASPWFFPSDVWMRNALAEAGFVVEKVETECRPTQLTQMNDEGSGGLEGWIKLMCADYIAVVDETKRADVVQWMMEVLEPVMKREDESWWIGYVRLRGVARKGI